MEEYLRKRGNQLFVYLPKELDHHFAQQIASEVDKELEKGAVKQLVLDFSDTVFWYSSVWVFFLVIKGLLSYRGGTFSDILVHDRILRIMQLSGIYKHIEISQEPVWNRRRK